MENTQPFVGIDVSSKRLDVDTIPVSQPFSAANTEDGIASLTVHLQALNPQKVVVEATGGYEIPVVTPSTARPACPWSLPTPKACATSPRPSACSPRPISWTPRSWHSCPKATPSARP